MQRPQRRERPLDVCDGEGQERLTCLEHAHLWKEFLLSLPLHQARGSGLCWEDDGS